MKIKKLLIYILIIIANIIEIKISKINLFEILLHIVILACILFLFNDYKNKYQKIKISEVLKKTRKKFLSNISHELRTPLNGIIGMNNLLLNTELTKQQREFTNTIKNCGEDLLTTMNDISDYMKIDSEALTIENIGFDLRKLLQDFNTTNKFAAEIKGLEFIYFIDPETTNYFFGDPGRIRQILSNFYNNAVKFTSNGSIELSCTILKDEDLYSILCFSIKDSGIGIPRNQIDSLFNEFSQLDSSLTRKYEGSGLGLSISNKLAKLLGGEIGATSHEGEGSNFWFKLKLLKKIDLLQPKIKIDIQEAVVLVVNSNFVRTSNLLTIFDRKRIKYILLETFKEVFDSISNKEFNLLVFDLNSETEKQINNIIPKIKEVSNIGLLGITAEGQRGDGERCRTLGIDGYLVKPLKDEPLFEIISMILGKKINSDDDLFTIHTLAENKRSKVKILIVDDNKINLIIAEKLLYKMGFHSDKAENGKIAIKMVNENNYNLILMDIQMPEMNGLQATNAIRNEEAGFHNKNIPIIALTANYTTKDQEDCSKAGMNAFLTKPYQPLLIEKAINKYIKWDEL